MIIFGGIAAFLCVLGLGLLWPHSRVLPFGVSIWSYFVKSLFLAWFWFLLNFYTPTSAVVLETTLIIFIFLAWKLFCDARSLQATTAPVIIESRTLTAIYVVAFFLLAAVGFASIGTIFGAWDPVVSWNRWGTELSQGEYRPLDAAYPVLWPAVWSIIYQAQETSEIWYVAKASIAAPIIFFAIFVVDRMREGRAFSGVFLCALIFYTFLRQDDFVVSGHMDMPAALFGLAIILLLVDALGQDDKDVRRELFLVGALSSAVALVTKQSGAPFAMLFLLVAGIDALRRRIAFRNLLVMAVIIVAPLLTYLLIYLAKQPDIAGNLGTLTNLVDARRGDVPVVIFAFGELTKITSPYFVFALVLLGCANALFIKTAQGMLGAACLLLGIAGFFLFAECCSYQWRNGLWVYSFLIGSAYISFVQIERKVIGNTTNIRNEAAGNGSSFDARLPFFLLVSFVAILFAIQAAFPSAALRGLQIEQMKTRMVAPVISEIVNQNEVAISNAPLVVSYYLPARYLPTINEFSVCRRTTPGCIRDKFTEFEDADELIVIYRAGNENKKVARCLARLVDNGKVREIANHRSFKLLEFRRNDWVGPTPVSC